jgi:adenylate cyclase
MSDVFISYARSTEAQARQIGEALRALGYGVWRDDEIPANRAYADVIAERLNAAKAVVVIWSAEAVRSQWVRSEAERARADDKLVQLSVDGARLPMPFDQTQCADLSGWTGGGETQGWKQVVDAVANLALPSRPKNESLKNAARKFSICVLPFANISDDPQQEYFSDGISEDIITDLSKVSALGVIARNTAFQFKGKSVDVPQIARQLNVSHVLEGSVRKAGNRVRISAQLIDGASGEHAWAERYDRDLSDIFALQDEISEAIVAALKVRLLPQEKKAIEKRGTDNVEAYNLYLMARRHFLSTSGKRVDLIIRLCQGAIDLDPAYALAWALMGSCKAVRARADATKAGDDGWVEAERALALDPNLAEAHATKARLLTYRGQFSEAEAEIDIALRLDPNSKDGNRSAGECAVATRRFADAVRYLEAAAADDEEDAASPFMAIQCYEALGDTVGATAAARKAVERLEKAIAREPDNGSLLAFGVGALAVLGEVERARDWAKNAVLIDPDNGKLRYNLACAMTRLRDVDSALQYLEAAYSLGGAALVLWAQNDSDLDPLRGDPGFQTLMARTEARFGAADGG